MEERYYPSVIIQDQNDARAYSISVTDYYDNLKDAIDNIERLRRKFRVLSAWVDLLDKNNKKVSVPFHECYVDIVGNIDYTK